ncbi:calcium uptake protein 3, mitochondrial isoform X1 [Leptopilina heterotoma]|uniref:calcium uptake protein 3, mitochondrial isoform X1 n=1 Tax=Leptopilina heterotoma TaxID=63436 RepID=UPI001CAA07DF|nr:calcium uptake protein 3, mitochondrial isoform X1 [Leptopilina heterotoma]
MASLTSLSRKLFQFSRNFRNVARSYYKLSSDSAFGKINTSVKLFVTGSIALILEHKYTLGATVYALKSRKNEENIQKAVRLTQRERRFIKFASVEFDGQLYMTPQDFLDSVVESQPRPRLKRRYLTKKELEGIKNSTPSLRHGNKHMFRSLRDKGIISYTEYLFLLSILTKPQTGFRIAFNMFDTDGNERVDKTEFLVLQKLIAPGEEVLNRKVTLRENQHDSQSENNQFFMEKIFSHAWRGRRGEEIKQELNQLTMKESTVEEIQGQFIDDDQGLQRRHLVDTSLMIHFFGPDGKNELKYEGFRRFMENLQHEVLELEFHEFSKGHDTITELDFAKILLRYTLLDADEYDKYLDRLLDRTNNTKGITFNEFQIFYQFLNNLDDFAIAMRMYTLADHPISKDEFSRAVKICTGTQLSLHIIDTVFAIFDVDGDGQLSYKEFIAIMKDRLHRGFKSQSKSEGWDAFKFCIKQEMKAP